MGNVRRFIGPGTNENLYKCLGPVSYLWWIEQFRPSLRGHVPGISCSLTPEAKANHTFSGLSKKSMGLAVYIHGVTRGAYFLTFFSIIEILGSEIFEVVDAFAAQSYAVIEFEAGRHCSKCKQKNQNLELHNWVIENLETGNTGQISVVNCTNVFRRFYIPCFPVFCGFLA